MVTDVQNSRSPKITVFTSHYNIKPEYLRRSVESIITQTFTDFEYIISDNCSTDGTAALLDEYAGKDSRIKVLHRKDNSPVKAWEDAMLNVASGQYLVFLDNDDYYDPNFLEEMYSLEKRTKADLIACGTEMFQENSPEKSYRKYYDLYVKTYSELKRIFRQTVWMIFATQWCKLFKMNIVRNVLQSDIFSEFHHCYHDTMFCLAYAMQSNSLAISSKVMHHYFLRPGSQVRIWNHIQIEWANGTYALFNRFLTKWKLNSPENLTFVREVYTGNIIQILQRMKDIKPAEAAHAFIGLQDILSSATFLEITTSMSIEEKDKFINLILLVATSLVSEAEAQGQADNIKNLYLYQIIKPIQVFDLERKTFTVEGMEAYLKGLYAGENICKLGKEWLGRVIRAYNDKMYEIFCLCELEFIVENSPFMFSLLRGTKQYPLIEELKKNRLIQKYAYIVTLLLNEDYAAAFPWLLSSCENNPDWQEQIILLETARTVAALQNDVEGFVLASKKKVGALIQQENYEKAAGLILDLEEMLPLDEDVLTCKVNLLIKTEQEAAARVLAEQISDYTDFSDAFKDRIRDIVG